MWWQLTACFAIWNGGIVYYAHGYTPPGEPIAVPDDHVGDQAVAEIVRGLGYFYAASSYRTNGLAAADGVLDMERLAQLLQSASPALAQAPSYLVGASEGGLLTALAMQNPVSPFDGGLSMCGPVGSFQTQVNYFGDFRLVFNLFFPGVLPGHSLSPSSLPSSRLPRNLPPEPSPYSLLASPNPGQ